jgi:hypothetical protein
VQGWRITRDGNCGTRDLDGCFAALSGAKVKEFTLFIVNGINVKTLLHLWSNSSDAHEEDSHRDIASVLKSTTASATAPHVFQSSAPELSLIPLFHKYNYLFFFLVIYSVGLEQSPLLPRPLIGLLYQPWMEMMVMMIVEQLVNK